MTDRIRETSTRLGYYARLLSDTLTLLQGVSDALAQDGLTEVAEVLSMAMLALEEAWAEASQQQAQLLAQGNDGTAQTQDFAGWKDDGPPGPRALADGSGAKG